MPYRRPAPRFYSGELTSQDAQNLTQLADDLYRLIGGFSSSPPINVQDDATGVRFGWQAPNQLRDVTLDGFWARITGAAGGPNGDSYPWIEQYQDADGVMSDMTGGRSGTATVLPAVPADGSTSVAVNSIVFLWLSQDKQCYNFSGGGSANRFLAKLTKKKYTPGQYIKYDWVKSLDTSFPTYPDFTTDPDGVPAQPKLWQFAGTTEAWSPTNQAPSASTYTGDDNAPGSTGGCLVMNLPGAGPRQTTQNYWELTSTWLQLFPALPSGATVSSISVSYAWRCSAFTGGQGCQDGPFEIRDSTGVLQAAVTAANSFSATSQWATASGTASSIPDTVSDPGSTIKLRLNNTLGTNAGALNSVELHQDFIQLSLTYRLPAYEINNIDLAVPLIVYLRPGAGAYYLIDMVPDWEIVQKTGPAQTVTFGQNESISAFPAELKRWKQGKDIASPAPNDVWEDVEFAYLIDANAP